ncbi:hypothetical protein ACMA5I_10925 [Paracoccaceae bacterium GXU_MW_L88]
MEDQDWTLKPLIGLGTVAFGRTLSEFEVNQQGFGPIERKVDRGGIFSVDQMPESEIRELIEVMGEDGAKEVLDSMRQADSNLTGLVDVFLPNGLRASFLNGALFSFQVDYNAERLQYDEHEFFRSDPLPALIALQNANDEPAFVEENSLWFDKLKVHVFGFLELNASGHLVRRVTSDEQGGDRAVAWGTEILIEANALANYRPMTIPSTL